MAVGPDGSVYVVDDLRDDIQRFTPDGVWLQTIGRHGPADGEMDNTSGIDVDPAGRLLNADSGNARIQAWDDEGTFLWSRGGRPSRGCSPGSSTSRPIQMARCTSETTRASRPSATGQCAAVGIRPSRVGVRLGDGIRRRDRLRSLRDHRPHPQAEDRVPGGGERISQPRTRAVQRSAIGGDGHRRARRPRSAVRRP